MVFIYETSLNFVVFKRLFGRLALSGIHKQMYEYIPSTKLFPFDIFDLSSSMTVTCIKLIFKKFFSIHFINENAMTLNCLQNLKH